MGIEIYSMLHREILPIVHEMSSDIDVQQVGDEQSIEEIPQQDTLPTDSSDIDDSLSVKQEAA